MPSCYLARMEKPGPGFLLDSGRDVPPNAAKIGKSLFFLLLTVLA